MPQEMLIRKLNPKISVWSNYFGSVCSKETFSKMDNLLFWKLYRWAIEKNPKKPRRMLVKKYWHKWRFSTPVGYKLNRHTDKVIERHIKVKLNKSPFDGDNLYWFSGPCP